MRPRQWAVLVIVLLVVISLSVVLLWPNETTDKPKAQEEKFSVLAPQDGDLVVDQAVVKQTAGFCDDKDVCSYEPVTDPVVVKIKEKTPSIPLEVGESTDLTLSVVNVTNPQEPVQAVIVDKRLLTDNLVKGMYQVGVYATESKGSWVFRIQVV